MIASHINDIMGSSFIFYFVTESHITRVTFLDFSPEAFDITTCRFWCQCICTYSFLILRYLILGKFEPCSGPFHEFMNNSRARLVIVTPKKISFPGFFVWLSKVIIPARHWRNRAFLSLWKTNFISIIQAVHNAPIHFTQMVNMDVFVTVNTRAINNIFWQLMYPGTCIYMLSMLCHIIRRNT